MARPVSLGVAAYVVDWQRHPWPLAWDEVFGRPAPLALEIGFGNGSFLEEEARAHPERNHVGIELSWRAATHLLRRLHRTGSSNVRILLGEAEALVRNTFPPRSLAEVFVNHPCPWPKARHVERRLLAREFLGLLAERMQAGARLTVVTDHAEYARWLADELAAQPALESCHATLEVPELAGRRPTKYQLKAMAQGIRIHYFQWRTCGPAAPVPPERRPPERRPLEPGPSEPLPPRPSELTMPTLTLSGARAELEPFRDFRPALFREVERGVEVVVRLEAVYRRADRPVWLVEALVIEDTLRQTFGIDVVLRGSTLLLKPSLLGQPYPTHGVKRAVWCVGRWLASRDPGLAVQHESLGLDEPAEPWPPVA